MFLTRWSPLDASWLRQVHDLHDEMNRLFGRGRNWNEVADDIGVFPPLNVWEEEEAFHVEAELPGATMKDVEIYVTGQNQLTLKGQRAETRLEKAVQHRQERHFGAFTRTLSLPSPVDENKVEARLENGVLRLRLPKHEGAKPRKIPIKS